MVLMESKQALSNGDCAPPFSLKGVDGNIHSLEGYKGAKALVVIFMCNHCPYVLAKVDTMKELHKKYSPKGVKFVGINSNNNPDYPDDSFEKMQEFAKQKGIEFDYLLDETQEVAKKYGATCTPDPFVFDSEQKLAYHGRFDDAGPGKAPTTTDLADALDAVLEGKAPNKGFLPSMGCSIKWRS